MLFERNDKTHSSSDSPAARPAPGEFPAPGAPATPRASRAQSSSPMNRLTTDEQQKNARLERIIFIVFGICLTAVIGWALLMIT